MYDILMRCLGTTPPTTQSSALLSYLVLLFAWGVPLVFYADLRIDLKKSYFDLMEIFITTRDIIS